MVSPSAAAVSARIEALIVRHHAGDRHAAALEIGIDGEQLSGLLSGDWQLFSLDALAAIIRQHTLSIEWLLRPAGALDALHALPIPDDERDR
jgi:hypothetical protein